ncbi:transporter substrate-binding domain-containing protein [Variovorax sp. PBL-E5]|uniref:transporter substrate-binding domain-containing protein n=1 Tax=Variovorax sp. PBL-E5 TaxID=434014 RepID=UPI00131810E1|nr:transporter substrate-binding domain-containing protein [Variovorax sp. PBL-E5]VTU25321.1 ABC transporter glutamine-binding protein GlnH precursor [Variovorax sp. PBL-E5]
MTNRRHFLASVAAAGAATTWTAQAFAQADTTESAWARIERTKVLRMGAVTGAAPYYHKDLASGEWQGFMIDFGKSLAASLNAKLDIHETTWGNSVLDLQSNKIDVFFGLNPTPARALVVDFSDPLFNNAFVLVARKGFDPKTWEELNKPEVKIAVDIGSSHDQVVTKTCPNAQIIRLEKAQDATLAVQTGRADCQVLAVVLALTVMSKNPSVGHIVLPTPTQATTTNLGFRKESDHRWVEYVNKWIAQTRASGKVKQVVLANMQTLSGVKPDQVPAEISF